MTQPQGYVLTRDLPPIPAKRYFTIGEVSQLCDVRSYVLRYWESEFTQLTPMKRRGNRRYYQLHEVMLVREIRELLYEKGYTIVGARRQLAQKMVSDAAKFELAPSDSAVQMKEVLGGVDKFIVADAHDVAVNHDDEFPMSVGVELAPKFIPVVDLMEAVGSAQGSIATSSVQNQDDLGKRLLVESVSSEQSLDKVIDDINGGAGSHAAHVGFQEVTNQRLDPIAHLQIHAEREASESVQMDEQGGEAILSVCDSEINDDLGAQAGRTLLTEVSIDSVVLLTRDSISVASTGTDFLNSSSSDSEHDFGQNSAQNTLANSDKITDENQSDSVAKMEPHLDLMAQSEQIRVGANLHVVHMTAENMTAENMTIALQNAETLMAEKSLQLKSLQEQIQVQNQEFERFESEQKARSEFILQAIAQLQMIRLQLDTEG